MKKTSRDNSKQVKRPILAAFKSGSDFTEEERRMIRDKAWRRSIDGRTMTHVAKDSFGGRSLLVFDVYVVEQLSVLERLRHSLRVFNAAIARNVGIEPRIVIITFE